MGLVGGTIEWGYRAEVFIGGVVSPDTVTLLQQGSIYRAPDGTKDGPSLSESCVDGSGPVQSVRRPRDLIYF